MKKALAVFLTLFLVAAFAACSAGQALLAPESGAAISATSTSTTTTTTTTTTTSTSTSTASSVAHDQAGDYAWDPAAAISIALNGNAIAADGAGVTVDGSTATITAAGAYRLSGSLADGQIIVDTGDEEAVRLILDGVELRSATSAPIYIAKAEKTVIVLADNTVNTVTDGASYVFADSAEDEPNAAIFSKGDLSIGGGGALTVNGNYNDGIASKDGLVIAGGAITVNAVDDGIRGKDYLVVKDGALTIVAQGDGLKSDDEEDPARGYVAIEAGVIQVTSGGDAIQAQTDVLIKDGQFTLTSGGGSAARIDEAASAKGIKGVASVNIAGGTFTIDAADDAIHSNGSVAVGGGDFHLATGDDGMHADASLEINGGEIRITRSYEGIESAVITLNAGNIHVVSSDDGINVAGGVDGSGMAPGGGPGRGQAQETFNYTGPYYLYVNGGTIVVDARGDGLDVNGAIQMTGGVVLVNGPTEQMNGALDYDAGFKMTGGFLAAAGSSGMAQAPGAGSSQNAVLIYLAATQPAGTLVHIQDSAGKDVLTFAPAKEYQSIAFSSPELATGMTYEVYLGGASTGAPADGLYQGGTYTPGARYESFTVSGVVTQVGASGFNRRRP